MKWEVFLTALAPTGSTVHVSNPLHMAEEQSVHFWASSSVSECRVVHGQAPYGMAEIMGAMKQSH